MIMQITETVSLTGTHVIRFPSSASARSADGPGRHERVVTTGQNGCSVRDWPVTGFR
jgi:hypothetical protein